MHNKRIEAWSFFCFENFGDRIWIERIGGQSVNRLRRESDNFTIPQKFDRFRAFLRGNDFRFHFGSFAASTASVCLLRNAWRFWRIFLSEIARMAAAKSAAFFAPADPIASVPTGMPPGICAIERSESKPCKADDSIGTPSTGNQV